MRKTQTPITAQALLIQRHFIFKSWAVVSEELGGVNRGMLCAVAGGKKPAPRPLIDRMNEVYHVHLRYETKIMVEALPCGHAPGGKRCPICQPPAPRQPDPVWRRKKVRNALWSVYAQS